MSSPIYAQPYILGLPGLFSTATDGAFISAPALTRGDMRVYKDGVLVTGGLTNLPINDPTGSPRLRFQFTAQEMTCLVFQVYLESDDDSFVDQFIEIKPHSRLNTGYLDLVFGAPDNGSYIKIRKTGSVANNVAGNYGVRLRFEVLETAGMPLELFVYHQRPLEPEADTFVGDFNHVCSPTDFNNYPINDVNAGTGTPRFYRSSFVDLVFDSISMADAAEQSLWDDLFFLKRNVDRLSRLTQSQDVVIGTDPDSSNEEVDPPEDPPETPAPTYGSATSLTKTPTLVRQLGSWRPWNTGTKAVSVAAAEAANYLILQGFDFSSVPATALLVGLQVSLGFASAPPGRLVWLHFYLPEGPVGDNLAASAPVPEENDADLNFTVTAGGATNLLTTNATAEDVRRGEFGLILLVDGYYGPSDVTIGTVNITAHWRPRV